MSQERLRELLRERVADESMPDLSGRAWQAARVVRRRRRLGAAAGVVAATVAVSGGIAAVDSSPSGPRRPADPATSDASPSPSPEQETPDATYHRVPVWFSPDPGEERELPRLDQDVLPAEVDLGDAPALADDPLDRAVAAFGVFDESRLARLVVLGPDGYRTVDLTDVEKVTKGNGYRLWPVSATMLAPDGRHLLLPQDGSVLVLTLADASWTRVDVELGSYGSHWIDDRTFFVPDFWEGPDVHGGGTVYDVTGAVVDRGASDVLSPSYPAAGQAQRYGAGPASPDGLRVAQAYGMGTEVPVRDPGSDFAAPESIWVADPAADAGGSVLSLTWPAREEGRWKECCPVAGWLDDDTLVYESRGTGWLVAWTVGTRSFERVAQVVGLDGVHESYVASWALAR